MTCFQYKLILKLRKLKFDRYLSYNCFNVVFSIVRKPVYFILFIDMFISVNSVNDCDI